MQNGGQQAESDILVAKCNPFQETTFKQEDYSSCTNKMDICSVDGQQNAQVCEQSGITVDLPEASYQIPVQENVAKVGKCPSKLVVSGNSDEELIANPLSHKGDVWQNVHTGISTPEKIINLSEQRHLAVPSSLDVTTDERAIFEHAGVEGVKYARADKKIDCLSADLDHEPKRPSFFPIAPQTPASAVVETMWPWKKRVAPRKKRRNVKAKQDIHMPNDRPQYLATWFEKFAQWLCGLAFVRTSVICCVVPSCSPRETQTQTTGQYFGQEVVLHVQTPTQTPTQVEDLSQAEQCVDSDFSSGEASATGRESNSSPLNDSNLGRGAEGGSDLPVSTGFGHHGKISYGDNSALHGLLDQDSFYGDQNNGEDEGLVLFEGLRLNNGRYNENMHFAKEGQPHRGAYGEVSFGVDIQSGMPFAVKKIPIGEYSRKEPRILNLFDNPNVIKLYGVIRRGNCIEIIMEKATNGTWFEMIFTGPIQEQETLQCLMGALTGLEQLHRCSIIHRDLKPNNIGLMADGRVVILDLGSATRVDDIQDLEGITSSYAAPEVCEPPHQCTPKMDIWSLGCCGLFLKLGDHPWNSWQEVRHYLDRIPFDCPGFKELLLGMLERDPMRRWDAKTCLSHIHKTQTTFEHTERRAIPDTVKGLDDLATDTTVHPDEPTSEAASAPLGDPPDFRLQGFVAEDDLATDTPVQPDEPTSEAASGPLGDPPNGSQANRNNENRGSIT